MPPAFVTKSDGFAERLKAELDARGLKQEAFADLVESRTGYPLDQSRVSVLRRGVLKPNLIEIEVCAYALDISPGWLGFEYGDKAVLKVERHPKAKVEHSHKLTQPATQKRASNNR